MHGWKLLAVFAWEPCGRWFWILDRGGACGAELQVRRERCRLAEGVPPGAVGEERGKQDFQRRDVFVLDIPHVRCSSNRGGKRVRASSVDTCLFQA